MVINLKGIGYFEGDSNTAYVAIENDDPVKSLHVRVLRCLRGMDQTETDGRFDLNNYHPHVTIGTNIPAHVFSVIKGTLSRQEVQYETRVASFSLFSNDLDGAWRVESTFPLSGELQRNISL